MTVGSDVKGCYYSIKHAQATLEDLALLPMKGEKHNQYKEAIRLLDEVRLGMHEQVLFLAREEPQY